MNAGIRGPADNDAETSPNSPKNSPKSIENGLEQRNSDEEEKIQMPNLTEGVENVKAEVKDLMSDFLPVSYHFLTKYEYLVDVL